MNNKDLFLILTSSSKIESADAVILLEGDGYSRILKATSLITEGWSDLLVFSGGIDNESVGSFTFEKCKSHLLNSGIGMDKIMHESNSQNTREQAVLREWLEKNNTSCLFISPVQSFFNVSKSFGGK